MLTVTIALILCFAAASADLLRTAEGFHSGKIEASDANYVKMIMQGGGIRIFDRSEVLAELKGERLFGADGHEPISPDLVRRAGLKLGEFTGAYYTGVGLVAMGALVTYLGVRNNWSQPVMIGGNVMTGIGGLVVLVSFSEIGAAGKVLEQATQ